MHYFVCLLYKPEWDRVYLSIFDGGQERCSSKLYTAGRVVSSLLWSRGLTWCAPQVSWGDRCLSRHDSWKLHQNFFSLHDTKIDHIVYAIIINKPVRSYNLSMCR